MRILFFGDGNWAVETLKRLLKDSWEVAGVVVRTQPNKPSLMKFAQTVGLRVFQPENVNEREFVKQIVDLTPDLNVSISYDQIFRRDLIDSSPNGTVNFHAGKLPNYRGRSVINWAIINGATEIGLTAHFMDEGIDTGDIVQQRIIPILWEDSYQEVLTRVVQAFPEFVAETLGIIAKGQSQSQRQSDVDGFYFSARGPGEEWIDWSDTSFNIYNKIRAISHPAPGARTLLESQLVIIWKAFYDPSWPKYIATPGKVIGRNRSEGVIVKTGDSTLLVQEVQISGDESVTPDWRIGSQVGMNLFSEVRKLKEQLEALQRESKSER
jgi:methionyl-tRNA formyltransferase